MGKSMFDAYHSNIMSFLCELVSRIKAAKLALLHLEATGMWIRWSNFEMHSSLKRSPVLSLVRVQTVSLCGSVK